MKLECKCKSVVLEIDENATRTRLRCACNACRGYSKFKGYDNLDAVGAVEVLQTTHDQVRIAKGADDLAANCISHGGIMRWGCARCDTPLANTLQKTKIAFMSLQLPKEMQAPNCPELGTMTGYVNAEFAIGTSPTQRAGKLMMMAGILWKSLWVPKETDWAKNGTWIIQPTVLKDSDRTKLYELAKTC